MKKVSIETLNSRHGYEVKVKKNNISFFLDVTLIYIVSIEYDSD